MKNWIMRIPEPIPFGLTFLVAMTRAMVSASFAKIPSGGKVETDFTSWIQRPFCAVFEDIGSSLGLDRIGSARGMRRLGDLLEDLAGLGPVAAVNGQVAKRDDADKAFLAVKDDEAADLLLFHHPGRVIDVLVFETKDNVLGHRVADLGGAWVHPFGNGAHGDVTIGDHAGQVVVVGADWKRADVEVAHPAGRLLERGVGGNTFGVRSHDILEQHRCFSL